jgi:hypothetical protein
MKAADGDPDLLTSRKYGKAPDQLTSRKYGKAPDLLTSRKYGKAPDLLVILIRELVSVLSLQQVRDCSPEVHVVKGALQKLFVIVNYSNYSQLVYTAFY